jgi:predicted negative regulator of RcsB-dependent stress response
LNRFSSFGCYLALISLPLAAAPQAATAPPAPSAPQAPAPRNFPVRMPVRDTGENQFAVSLNMFATLAAINAAGYDAGMDSALNEKFKLRTQLREILAKKTIPCLSELRAFYKEHKKPTDSADFGQYISFALVAGDAPKFAITTSENPPEVEGLNGFSELLARFYQEADIEGLWNRSQNAYTAAMAEYQDPVINALFEANGYLRNPSGYLGRRFQIYLDLLGAPNQIQVRSYRNDYFVVITPTSTPVVDEIRDAYFAYVLDPLTYKYSSLLKEKQVLLRYAADAPALDVAYKDDFSLLVTKCLIKALDSRLLHGNEEKRQAYVDQAMREGYILTAVFAELLQRYEHQPDALRLYYPDMIAAIDVKREQKRLKIQEFAQSAPVKIVAPPAKMMLDPAEQALQTAEGLYETGNYDEALKVFKSVSEQTTDKAMHGRAYYGLARIAVRQQRAGEARQLFQKTVDANPNPTLTAWSHVYLGRLALASKDTGKAITEFQSALSTDGASLMAKEAAQKDLDSTNSSSGEKHQ